MIIWLITGLWIALSCAWMAHMITLFTDGTLQTYTQLGGMFVLVGLFAYIAILFLARKKLFATSKQSEKVSIKVTTAYIKDNAIYMLLFGVLASVSIAHFCSNYVPALSDATYELVLGNLQSGNIHSVHPFTGGISDAVMPLRRQAIGLASFYSAIISMVPASAYVVLCKIVPICLWCFSMLLYWAFGAKLFEKHRDRWFFMCVIAFFYLVSKGGAGMPAGQLFFAGFSGEAIRAVLLLPYALYVSWQKKWLLAILAILVEVGIAWTTFGVGYSALIVACMILVHLFMKWRGKHAARVE